MAFERSTVQTITKGEAAAKSKAQAAGAGKAHNVASRALARPAKGKLYAPLENLVASSPFGLRVDPFSGRPGEFHWGQDFAAACGTRVYAADAGVVRAVGWHLWGGGNRVEIQHADGLITTYNHLRGIGVQRGEPVRVGQVIAEVGTTGSSTGCHLHFETVVNGVHANPAHFTFLPIRQVDPLDEIRMVSYAPGSNGSKGEASGRPDWAVPVAAAPERPVAGGSQERPSKPSASGKASSKAPSAPAPSKTTPPSGSTTKPPSSGTTAPSSPSQPGTSQPSTPSQPAPSNPGTTTPGTTTPGTTTPTTPTTPGTTTPVTPSQPGTSTPGTTTPTVPTSPTSPTPTSPTPTAPKPTYPTSPAPTSPTPTAPPPSPSLLDPVTGLVGGVVCLLLCPAP